MKLSAKSKKYLKLVAKIILTIIALLYIYYKIDLKAVAEIIRRTNFYMIYPAILLFVVSKVLSSFRLTFFLRCIPISMSERENLRLYWLGMFYNLFLPGGIGGDGYKVFYINQEFKAKVKTTIWAILLDRVIGLLALFCLAVGLSYIVPFPEKWKYLVWSLIPLSILIAFFVMRWFFRKFSKVFWITNLYSLLVQLAQVGAAFFILKGIGIRENILLYLFLFLISSIISVLPITIGGLGAREVTFVIASQWFLIDVNGSITLSLVFYMITALVSLVGIYYTFNYNKIKHGRILESEIPDKKDDKDIR